MWFFSKLLTKKNQTMPTIGIAGVTIPGAIDCIKKINLFSSVSFEQHRRPNIKLDQPDFYPLHKAQNESDWNKVSDILVDSIHSLAQSRADFAIIPANTVHIVIEDIQKRSPIPVLNMLEIVSDTCFQKGLKTVGVVGTRWTMANHLYKKPFEKRNIIEVVPSDNEQMIIQKAIFSELVPQGCARNETLLELLHIINNLKKNGCDAVILACTELPLVLNCDNCGLPALDTGAILAQEAVTKSLRIVAASYDDKNIRERFDPLKV